MVIYCVAVQMNVDINPFLNVVDKGWYISNNKNRKEEKFSEKIF